MFCCSQCNYSTRVKCNLAKHEKTHLRFKIPKCYNCLVCGFSTKKTTHYQVHMESNRHRWEVLNSDMILKLKSEAVDAPIEWDESICKSIKKHLEIYRNAFMNDETEVIHRLKNGKWETMSLDHFTNELKKECPPDLPFNRNHYPSLRLSLWRVYDDCWNREQSSKDHPR